MIEKLELRQHFTAITGASIVDANGVVLAPMGTVIDLSKLPTRDVSMSSCQAEKVQKKKQTRKSSLKKPVQQQTTSPPHVVDFQIVHPTPNDNRQVI